MGAPEVVETIDATKDGKVEHMPVTPVKVSPKMKRVFHSHYRFINEELKSSVDKDGNKINPRGIETNGGCTVAVVEFMGKYRWGVSRCNKLDTFCKRTGRSIAYIRAKGSIAAETPILDIKGIRVVANEFARTAFETTKEFPGVFNHSVAEQFSVENPHFYKFNKQTSLL